jgi:hypothetical protein
MNSGMPAGQQHWKRRIIQALSPSARLMLTVLEMLKASYLSSKALRYSRESHGEMEGEVLTRRLFDALTQRW